MNWAQVDDPAITVTIALRKDRQITQGIKPNSINAYLRHIRGGLNTAVEWDWLKKAPKITMTRVPRRNPKPLDTNQIKVVKKYAKENDYDMYRIIVFALYTGCRRSEIINVKWQDVSGGVCRIVGKGDIGKQTEQCIGNVEDGLKKLGASLEDVVQVTVFVKEMSGLKTIHEVRRRRFKEPYPTSTLVEVSGFVHPDALIEINAVAAL